MNGYRYYWLILFSAFFSMCQNRTKISQQEIDPFSLLIYPKWFDTLDCSRANPDWKPYPCLELDKKSSQVVDSLYGEALTTYIDTLYYGVKKDDEFYDPEIADMLLNIPVVKVTYTYRKDMGYILILYFIEYNNQNLVFYGYRASPFLMME